MENECQVVVVPEIQTLPSDAVYEILTRVSLVHLLRQCRWVCKDWQKLIMCDPQFQKKHLKSTPSLGPGCFVYDAVMKHVTFVPYVDNLQGHKLPEVSSPFLDFLPKSANDIRIDCSSQFGSLLCCVTKPELFPIPSYYICKPATREWRKIPNPKTRLARFPKTSLARVPKVSISIALTQSYPRLQFKVLRLCQSQTGYGRHCEVFDSNNWTWKRKKFIKFTRGIEFQTTAAVFLNGGFHWSTYNYHIFVYYVDEDKWTWLEYSPEMLLIRGASFVINYYGKLGVIVNDREWMEVWILESYSTTEPIWKRKFRNDIRWIYEKTPTRRTYLRPVEMWSTNIVVMGSFDEIVWFNCDKDTRTTIPYTSISDIQSTFHPEHSYF